MHTIQKKKRLAPQAQTEKSNTPQSKNNPFLKADAQPKGNPFLNNTQVTQQKAVVQMGKKKNGNTQKGVFIGDASACHIHIVGDNDHFRVGSGKRINLQKHGSGAYFLNSINNCLLSIQEYAGMKGYDACLNWLQTEQANAV
jgi:biopolymer transport protein ExbD